MIGLISNNDESIEVQNLVRWCSMNHLTLNRGETKELIIDFRRSWDDDDNASIYINRDRVQRASSFRILGIQISKNISMDTAEEDTSTAVLLRMLKKLASPQQVMLTYYHCTAESILTYCICICVRHLSQEGIGLVGCSS